MVRLQPGETYAMDTEWYPSRAGKEVLGVTDAGVIVERLRVSGASGNQRLSGTFGVFFEGKIVAKFLDKDGKAISRETLRDVTPRESVKLDREVLVPAGAKRAALCLIDSEARERGLLDEVPVAPGGVGD
jgi:hypothetical protein